MRERFALTLALCIVARPLSAEPRAFRVPGEIPFPEWVRSAQVIRADEPIYQGPSGAEPRRGAAARGARLPVFGSQRGPGCKTRFLLVGALAWLCEDGAELSPDAPDTDNEGALPRSHGSWGWLEYHESALQAPIEPHTQATARVTGPLVTSVGQALVGRTTDFSGARSMTVPIAVVIAPHRLASIQSTGT